MKDNKKFKLLEKISLVLLGAFNFTNLANASYTHVTHELLRASPQFLLYLAFFGILGLVVVLFLIKRKKDTLAKDWQSLSLKLGLRYKKGNLFRKPWLEGSYRKHFLKLTSLPGGASKLKVKLQGNKKRILLQINDRMLSSFSSFQEIKEENLVGSGSLKNNNPQFNKKYAIRDNDSSEIKRIVDPAIQEKFLKFNLLEVKVEGDILLSTIREDKVEKLEKTIDVILDIAEKIE